MCWVGLGCVVRRFVVAGKTPTQTNFACISALALAVCCVLCGGVALQSARTEATLLEYGEAIVSTAAGGGGGADGDDDPDRERADARAQRLARKAGGGLDEKEAAALKAEAEERAKKVAEHAKRMAELKKELESGGEGSRVTGATAGQLIQLQAELIKQSQAEAEASAAATALLAGGEDGTGVSGGGGKDAWRVTFDRQMANLQKRIKAEEEKLNTKQQ
jgi:hypothetical protein